MDPGEPVRVCFVCLGNICRSPTAEGVMQQLVADAGLSHAIELDSAGTGAWHVGERADPRSRAAASARGFPLTSIARQFVHADVGRFEYLIAMDHANRRRMLAMAPARARDKIHLLRAFDPSAPEDAEVPDPYYEGDQGFERVLDMCERACRGLLRHICERYQLEPSPAPGS
ncbi:MAG: low molecular weight protein-tyrosine-phosphatase [Haliangiales bacterium]